MRKKKTKIIRVTILVVLAMAIVSIIAITQSSKWSQQTFDAVVEEVITQTDGEVRLIVVRTTEIYSNPMNSLGISEDTELFDKDGNSISVTDFQRGDAVRVTLKNAFTEETPFYYPTVYEIKIMNADK